MAKVTSEDMIRIEHKLDVIIKYLHNMTGVRPAPLPQIIERGVTTGVCPITTSPIVFNVDVEDGRFVRSDALLESLPRFGVGITPPKAWDIRQKDES
ncbi:MAG: hypothetical protein ACO32I_04910 [Candidatus Limnocylindrus sp.]